MKKFLLLFGLGVGVLGAGDYHYGETLVCSQCHVMHYSQSHGYEPPWDEWIPLGPSGPYEGLLRNDEVSLCLSCHDGVVDLPDVFATNVNNNVRQAGALNSYDSSPYEPATGHTLGSTEIAPGSDPPWNDEDGLKCSDCHDPHSYNPLGNPYRNLRADPGNYKEQGIEVIVTYAIENNDLIKDVYERSATPGPSHYDISNVDFNEPDPTESAYGRWCKGCHTLVHGSPGDPNMGGESGIEWLRHPTAGADIGAVGDRHSSKRVFSGRGMGKQNYVKVMTSTENWTPHNEDEVVDHTPSCFSCHKAHGNKNPFGLIFMRFRGTVTEEGTSDGEFRHLCGQCHVQPAHPRQGPGECNECHPRP